MAVMYPDSINHLNHNEKVLYTSLRDKTPKNFHVWFKKGEGYKATELTMLCSDFNFFRFFMYPWEMKDFSAIAPQRIELELRKDQKVEHVAVDLLENDPKKFKKSLLDRIKENPYFDYLAGNIQVEQIYVFPNIYESDFLDLRVNDTVLGKIFERNNCLLKEDMDRLLLENDVYKYLKSILALQPSSFSFGEEDEVTFLRHCINPVIGLGNNLGSFLQTLDIEQEQIVNLSKDTNLLLQGKSSTGKTTILMKRLELLSKANGKHRYLFVGCNGHSLKKVKNEILKNVPDYGLLRIIDMEGLKDEFHNNSYDFVFVDDGEDFTKESYTKLKKLLKENGHIWIASNGAQNIYDHEMDYKSLGFDLNEIVVLKKNYRNSKQITEFAELFLERQEVPIKKSDQPFDVNYLPETESVIHRGLNPEIHHVEKIDEQMTFILSKIEELYDLGENYKDMGILLLNDEIARKVEETLNRKKIPTQLLNSNGGDSLGAVGVVIASFKEVKGQEFSSVFLLNFGRNEDSITKKMIYLGMMRAKSNLFVIIHHKSMITEEIHKAYSSLLTDEHRNLEFHLPAYKRMLFHELTLLNLKKNAQEREKDRILKEKSELTFQKEDLTTREMRAIISEGPKDVELLKKQIIEKDAKIEKLKKEIAGFKSKNKEESLSRMTKFMKNIYIEREKLGKILKVFLIVVLVLILYTNFEAIDRRFNLKDNVVGFYEKINSKLQGNEIEETEEYENEWNLEVLGSDTEKLSYIKFDLENSNDFGKLVDGYYEDGFIIRLIKEKQYIKVELKGYFKELIEGEFIQIDKVLDLESRSVMVKINSGRMTKVTPEGIIPVQYLWEKDEEEFYFKTFE